MENKKVGYLILGIAIILGIIIYLFNSALTSIVSTSCSHGPSCPMYGNIKTQTTIGIVLLIAIALIGILLIFNKERERIIVKTKKIKDEFQEKLKELKEKNKKLLNKEEKLVYEYLLNEGSMFQADLVDRTQLGKVKVSRILDRLEAKNLIERKRRGMTNIVQLK